MTIAWLPTDNPESLRVMVGVIDLTLVRLNNFVTVWALPLTVSFNRTLAVIVPVGRLFPCEA